MRMSSNGRAPASQAGDAGSIPVIRSIKKPAASNEAVGFFAVIYKFRNSFFNFLSMTLQQVSAAFKGNKAAIWDSFDSFFGIRIAYQFIVLCLKD